MPESQSALLRVTGLSKAYPVAHGRWRGGSAAPVMALNNVSFEVPRSTTLGIVGESGSGKTTLVRSVLRAIEPTAGECWFRSEQFGEIDLAQASAAAMTVLRRELQMIFQDPFSSLNPRMSVGQILAEPLIIHGLGNARERAERIHAMLDLVKLPRSCMSRYPHAFSGGQRQRIGIARALMLQPALVVCDESVSALDVSVQAQIINLLEDLQAELGLTYLFVAHDLAVVRHICDDVLVMHQGQVVESAPVEMLFEQPAHAYTRRLLSAIPSIDPDVRLPEVTGAQ